MKEGAHNYALRLCVKCNLPTPRISRVVTIIFRPKCMQPVPWQCFTLLAIKLSHATHIAGLTPSTSGGNTCQIHNSDCSRDCRFTPDIGFFGTIVKARTAQTHRTTKIQVYHKCPRSITPIEAYRRELRPEEEYFVHFGELCPPSLWRIVICPPSLWRIVKFVPSLFGR